MKNRQSQSRPGSRSRKGVSPRRLWKMLTPPRSSGPENLLPLLDVRLVVESGRVELVRLRQRRVAREHEWVLRQLRVDLRERLLRALDRRHVGDVGRDLG